MLIVNVHLHGEGNREDAKILLLDKLKRFLEDWQLHFIFIIGDFNFVCNLEDRISLKDGKYCGKICKGGEY